MKKILAVLLMLFIPMVAFADYTFKVENTEMVDAYFNVFNAIAMIFSTQSYLDLLRLVFLVGGFFVFLGAILAGFGAEQGAGGAIKKYASYTIGGFIILSVVFSGKTTLWVQTDNLPGYCSSASPTTGTAIDNVPEKLAWIFVSMNQGGRELTRMAEMAFSTPSSAGSTSMADNGGFIGSLKSSQNLLNVDFSKISMKQDPSTGKKAFDTNRALSKVFSECIYIPYSAKGTDGQEKIDEFASSTNTEQFLDNLFAGAVTVGGINTRDYTLEWFGETWTCGGFYDALLKPSLVDVKSQLTCSLDGTAGSLQVLTQLKDAPISTYEDSAMQAGMVNQIQGTTSMMGVGISGIGYATGKTKAEFYQSSMATGSYMAEMLPFLQMTVRAILYAFFPFVFIVIMLPGGFQVAKQYLQTLLWVELWSPTAAIVNMFIVKQAEAKIGGKIYQADGGITASNSLDMLSTASTISGIAGYLYAMVPALTWLILKGSGDILGNVAGAMGAKMASNITSDSMSSDQQKMSEKEAMSEKLGRAVSYGETQHYQKQNQGWKSGASGASEHLQGKEAIVDKADYDTSNPYSVYDGQKEGAGGKKPLLDLNAHMSKKETIEKKTFNDNTTEGDFEGSGLKSAGDKKASAMIGEKFGVDGVARAKFVQDNASTIKSLTEADVLSSGYDGKTGQEAIDSWTKDKATFDTNKDVSNLKNVISNIGDKTPGGAGAAVGGADAKGTIQNVNKMDQLTNDDVATLGKLDGFKSKGVAEMIEQHPEYLKEAMSNSSNQTQEDIVGNKAKYDMIQKEYGKDAADFYAKVSKLDTSKKIGFTKVASVPLAKGAGEQDAIIQNATGKVVDNHGVAPLQKLSDNQAENKVSEETAKQERMIIEGKSLRSSSNSEVQDFIKKQDKLNAGFSQSEKDERLAAAFNGSTDMQTKMFNERKDKQLQDDLKGQGITPETLGTKGPNGAGDIIQGLNKNVNEAKTVAGAVDIITGDMTNTRDAAVEKITKANPTLSKQKIEALADQEVVSALAGNKLFNKDVTDKALISTHNSIEDEKNKSLKEKAIKNLSAKDQKTIHDYEVGQKGNDFVRAEGGFGAFASDDKEYAQAQKNLKKAMSNYGKTTADGKAIVAKANNEEKAVLQQFANIGAVKLDKAGNYVGSADTKTDMASRSEKDRFIASKALYGAMSGNQISTPTADGMGAKIVDNVNHTSHVTNLQEATKGYSRKGEFNDNFTYHIADNGFVSNKNIARIYQGVSYVDNGVKDLAGAGVVNTIITKMK